MKLNLIDKITSGFIAVLSLVLVNGCSPTSESNPQSKEKVMLSAAQTVAENQHVPPIDAAAPEHYETATFALG